MRTVALPDYKATVGNRGAFCLHRVEGEVAHFDMLTFGQILTQSSGLPRQDYEVAKYYDFDRSFLIELEPTVRHTTPSTTNNGGDSRRSLPLLPPLRHPEPRKRSPL